MCFVSARRQSFIPSGQMVNREKMKCLASNIESRNKFALNTILKRKE